MKKGPHGLFRGFYIRERLQTLSNGRSYFENLRPVHLAMLFDQPMALTLGG